MFSRSNRDFHKERIFDLLNQAISFVLGSIAAGSQSPPLIKAQTPRAENVKKTTPVKIYSFLTFIKTSLSGIIYYDRQYNTTGILGCLGDLENPNIFSSYY